MTKRELIDAVAGSHLENDLSKKVIEAIIEDTFAAIRASVKKDQRFAYPNFGTFTVRKRAARKGRNPQTGEEIKIKASQSIHFKASPTFKDSL